MAHAIRQKPTGRFWQEEHRRSVRRAAAAGVLIAAGSDAAGSLPGGDVLVREIVALIEGGLSAARALRATTLDAARVLGVEDRLGSLQPGKAADLVVVDSDPLTDIWTLATPRIVVARGRVVLDERNNQGRLPAAPSREAMNDLAGLTSRWTEGAR
ncbi:MAG TPA: amidohydrolase family protein [Chloroflexota bacterium]|nr:amidohydrolase family protein [Chloroflexota bacterium]